jgi:uncharacterized membrane protein YagU involved in acid resistance
MQEQQRSVLGDAIDGAIAGLVATWVMGKVTTLLYERQDERATERENQARGGKSAYGVAAEKGARIIGLELSDEQRQKYGSGVHWVLGIAMGAAYGVLRPRLPHADAGHGLLFGTAFFLAVDEIGNTVLGLTPPPQEFPWQAHARGLAGHLTYGAVADTVARL